MKAVSIAHSGFVGVEPTNDIDFDMLARAGVSVTFPELVRSMPVMNSVMRGNIEFSCDSYHRVIGIVLAIRAATSLDECDCTNVAHLHIANSDLREQAEKAFGLFWTEYSRNPIIFYTDPVRKHCTVTFWPDRSIKRIPSLYYLPQESVIVDFSTSGSDVESLVFKHILSLIFGSISCRDFSVNGSVIIAKPQEVRFNVEQPTKIFRDKPRLTVVK